MSRSRCTRVLRGIALPVAAVVALTVPAVGAGTASAAPAAPVVHDGAGHVEGDVFGHTTEPQALTAGATITTATGASYAFSAVIGGKPVRWNPCTAIHWRANVLRAPLGGLDALKAAVASVAATTGTTWVFDGTTSTAPTSSWLPTTSTSVKPVLIGWADSTTSDLLRYQPTSTLGMTRTKWYGKVSSTGATVAATRGAVIALDRTDRLPLRGNGSWTAVALHELGHAMGLAHPADSGELMNSVLPMGLASFQTGDRKGLYYVGRSQGCISF